MLQLNNQLILLMCKHHIYWQKIMVLELLMHIKECYLQELELDKYIMLKIRNFLLLLRCKFNAYHNHNKHIW